MPDLTPELFLAHLFGSRAARDGAVVRRKVRDVERVLGRDAFRRELDRRGYSAVENSGQFVIFCNREPLRPFAGEPASVTEAVPETGSGFWQSFRRRKLEQRP